MASIERQAPDAANLGARSSDAQRNAQLPEVVVYEHDDFQGFEFRTNLDILFVGDDMNDQISSIIVVSGVWEFFEHRDFQGASCRLGPGYYGSVELNCGPHGVHNDTISSFRVVSF